MRCRSSRRSGNRSSSGSSAVQHRCVREQQVLLVANNGGAWISELAVPYVLFVANGYDVTIACPGGGQVPVKLESEQEARIGPAVDDVQQFLHCDSATQMMKNAVPLESVKSMDAYSALFLTGKPGAVLGGPEAIVDQPEHVAHAALKLLVQGAFQTGKVVAAIGDGCAVFTTMETTARMILGKKMAAPPSLQARLRDLGAEIVPEDAVADGNLITGASPASARRTATLVLEAMSTSPVAASQHPGTLTALEAGLVHTHQTTAQLLQEETVPEPGYQDLGPAVEPSPGAYTHNATPASA